MWRTYVTTESEGFGPDGSGAKLAEVLSGVDPFLTATPEDVADAVFFLASAQARSITGQALAVDGGALLG